MLLFAFIVLFSDNRIFCTPPSTIRHRLNRRQPAAWASELNLRAPLDGSIPERSENRPTGTRWKRRPPEPIFPLPCRAFDENALTKGRIRKLNGLRKTVRNETAERHFSEWLSSLPTETAAADNNAERIADALCPSSKRAA